MTAKAKVWTAIIGTVAICSLTYLFVPSKPHRATGTGDAGTPPKVAETLQLPELKDEVLDIGVVRVTTEGMWNIKTGEPVQFRMKTGQRLGFALKKSLRYTRFVNDEATGTIHDQPVNYSNSETDTIYYKIDPGQGKTESLAAYVKYRKKGKEPLDPDQWEPLAYAAKVVTKD
jgi:hypothetical protein